MRLRFGTLLSFALACPVPALADTPEAAAGDASVDQAPRSVAIAIAAARAQIDALELAAAERPPTPVLVDRTVVGLPPAALTSDTPPAAEPEVEPEPRVAWLQDLVMPDFPVRFDDRLVELLTYYREDARGRAHIRGWLQRAGRYEDMIRGKLRAAGLPEDLLFVPMVESGFEPTARSGAAAVGMWQFVAPTAREFGLQVDRWADQRQSPEEATDAGIAYFAQLYGRLGSWPLSLAAFNMGYGALSRAIRKYNSNDFWVLAELEAGLPYETVVYVAKVAACAIVAKNPERFGLQDLQPLPAENAVRVQVSGGAGLGRLARAAGVSVDELAALNPELRRKRLPPDVRTWKLRIPADRLGRFEKRWKEYRPAAGTHRTHVLRFGERLRDVAEMYGTTADRLRSLNDLQDDAELRPGHRLQVPDVEVQPTPRDGVPVAAVPAARFDYPDRTRAFYQVIPGDTGGSIAHFFGVTLDELRKWNDITPEARLHSGMMLQLFIPRSVDLAQAILFRPDEVEELTVGSEAFFDYHEAQQDRDRIRYRVKDGDTLASIAKRFELSVGSIARINRFSRYSTPDPDSEIILYVPRK